jgi:hypothetical protein
MFSCYCVADMLAMKPILRANFIRDKHVLAEDFAGVASNFGARTFREWKRTGVFWPL